MGEAASWQRRVEGFVLDQIGDPPARVLEVGCGEGDLAVALDRDGRRCRGLHRLADVAYLSGFLCCALPYVAPYCVRGGVRVVSIALSYPPHTVVHL
jgi:hypothetical protein